MSDLKDDKKITGGHLPYLISIFLVFAERLPDEIDEKEAALIQDYRNKIAHDPLFRRNQKDVEEFLRLAKRYVDKGWMGSYATYVGADVESRLASTEAHDRGHAAFHRGLSEPSAQPKTPAGAKFLLRPFLSNNDLDALVGDLTEMYYSRHERCGRCRAKLWFYGQVIISIWPLLKRLISTKWLRHPTS
jgi:hypothetical protein